MENARQHWDTVYSTKRADQVSWYQREPEPSLTMIAETAAEPGDGIVDVGSGASLLVDRLLDRGYGDLTALDVSAASLELARQRLGDRGRRVAWVAEDVTRWRPAPGRYRVWHDRAVFHFLTTEADRAGYLRALQLGLRTGGFLILAPFAPSGPDRCSGLPVIRYSARMLQDLLGPAYCLLREETRSHLTPAGMRQDFAWCLFARAA